jgi:hypothetical protein
MAKTVQHKRGTAGAMAGNNPTLAAGEIGIETDTLRIKIGDGSTSWNSLAYQPLILSYTTTSSFPATGSTSSYYFASDTSRLYQWTGSQYVEIGPPMTGVANAQASINLFLWSNFR